MSNFQFDDSKEITCTFEPEDIERLMKYVEDLRLTKIIISNYELTMKTLKDHSVEYLLYDKYFELKNILINTNQHIAHNNKKINKNRKNTKNYTYLFILVDKLNNDDEVIFTFNFGDELLFQRYTEIRPVK
jgi:hypothetical protein